MLEWWPWQTDARVRDLERKLEAAIAERDAALLREEMLALGNEQLRQLLRANLAIAVGVAKAYGAPEELKLNAG